MTKAQLSRALFSAFPGMQTVSVIFVTSKEIQRLNREFRQKEVPTDVISFDFIDGIGEIYLCPDFIFNNLNGVDFTEEVVRMCVHGILHITGYDHKGYFTQESEEEMFKVQEKKVKEVINLRL